MKVYFHTIIILLSLSITACYESQPSDQMSAQQQTPDIQTVPSQKKIIVAAPSVPLPPYFCRNEIKGLEKDIIKEAFEISGYSPHFIHKKGREQKLVEPNSTIACVTTVNEASGDLSADDGYFSDDVIAYQDVVITLKIRQEYNNFKIESIKDLKGLTVETFNSAYAHLGFDAILGKREDNPRFHEHSGKASQVILLYRGRLDALIIDKRVFAYFFKTYKQHMEEKKYYKRKNFKSFEPIETFYPLDDAINVYPHIFKESKPYKIFCKDEKILKDFNQGLATLKQTGRYQQIMDEYPDPEAKQHNDSINQQAQDDDTTPQNDVCDVDNRPST